MRRRTNYFWTPLNRIPTWRWWRTTLPNLEVTSTSLMFSPAQLVRRLPRLRRSWPSKSQQLEMLLKIINHKLQWRTKRKKISSTMVSSPMLKRTIKRRRKSRRSLTSRISEKTSKKVGIWHPGSKRRERSAYLPSSTMMTQTSWPGLLWGRSSSALTS